MADFESRLEKWQRRDRHALPQPVSLIKTECKFGWGSHGCNLAGGHPGKIHQCGPWYDPCSQYDEETGRWRNAPDGSGSNEWWVHGNGYWYG